MAAATGQGAAARKGRAKGSGLLSDYAVLPGVFDEMVDGNGRPRPHWTAFIAHLEELGPAEISRRFEVADRSLRDSGVFYRVYDQADGGERPWPLSHVPLILSVDEWKSLSKGLVQRARLLEAVLQDAYGPGRLVTDGVLPATAIAGCPEFLRPMVGLKPVGGRHLRIYAVDLGRGPDGKWWVLGDRAQAPSGAGYAIENRLALSRALPDIYRSLQVERLAPFFQAFRAGLAELVQREDPRLCLLTPGSLNETYFEHAYLARYLGFLLVEGGDLTVRDGNLYIRTVAGLKRADAVLRRLDGDFADPLELNARSQIGVPGLVDALRHNSLVMANSLGSGLIESRAMMSFLPALGGALLGEGLELPNVATWWCGQPAEREVVRDNLERLAIAAAFGSRLPGRQETGALLGAGLDADGRKAMLDLIDRRGVDVVGQEIVKLSTMPVWNKGRLEPRPFILRVFVAATHDGWQVMPGGFCRLSDDRDARALTMQQGGSSADVWVLAGAPVPATTLLPPPDRMPIRRAAGVLPSRAADNMFWLGRYLERAEATLRLVRALTGRLGDTGSTADRVGHRIVALLEAEGAVPVGLAFTNPIAAAEATLGNRQLPGAVPVLVENAKRTASVIRDRLSPDAWRVLIETEALFAGKEPIRVEGDAFERANAALTMIAAFSGLAQENMNRSMGWRFLELGRRIERGIGIAMVVRHFGVPEASARWLDILLELADSQMTYRTRYIVAAARPQVIDLVVLDPGNPRSLAYQVNEIADHLALLPGLDDGGLVSQPVRIARRLQTQLLTADAAAVSLTDVAGVESQLMALSNEIAQRYFTHRSLPGVSWDGLG
ncbi:circularly permuted type 2 ATP-grasp protein [Pseudoxanthobacter sp.]|uniref:circularly permuted type 2 ATP-grasp protein n=1 Tax=Pseudoxanthobacter sp. TaxID=1925742 RepID=UPI002FDF1150